MPYISIWIKSLLFAVITIIAVGGITRLTHSGLSMTSWKPLNFLPPINDSEWNNEFKNYKETPEYLKINKGMELNEFKKIFWWEYIHRLLARLIGILAVLPILFYFKIKDSWIIKKAIQVFCLVAFQGFIGWWMVKSGLVNNPSVSHFRLCIHLIMAFFIITILLDILWKNKGLHLKKIEKKDQLLLVFLLITIIYGAFVAGLKAGFIYNTFPLMGDSLLPDEWHFYQPLAINFVNNPATVQFTHRLMAILTFCYSCFLLYRFGGNYKIVTIKIFIQVILGITTLIFVVPLKLGVLHQLWAVVVWIACLKNSRIKRFL